MCAVFPLEKDGANSSGVKTCDAAQNIYCFALWDTKIKDNKTVAVVHKKDCFIISHVESTKQAVCSKECVQKPHYDAFKSGNVSGFCCCTEDMCNTNFTMVEYDEEPTKSVAPTTGTLRIRQLISD